jgi:hypothetical protein
LVAVADRRGLTTADIGRYWGCPIGRLFIPAMISRVSMIEWKKN